MDGARFDDLARQLAGRKTRRSVLRGLAGLAAGAVGLGATKAVTAACPTGQVAASGGRCVCKSTMRPPGPSGCPAGPGQTLCNGVAVDLTSDVNNCGSCGYVCPAGSTIGACAGTPVCRANLCLYPPLPAGTVCRPAVDVCDATDVCDGASLQCPADAKAPAGTPCDDGQHCTVDDQCNGQGACAGTLKDCSGVADQCNDGVCRPSDGACVKQPKANGLTCETGNRCTADTCQAGVCSQGQDVVTPTCPAPTQCQQSVSCTPATGLCTTIVNEGAGAPCGNPASCAAGSQHAQDTCNGSGTCVAGANTSCGLYLCNGTTCRTTCTDDNHCVPEAHCDGGQCLADGANGATCDEASDCISGFCNATSHICCSADCGPTVGCTGANFTCPPACTPQCTGKACGAEDGCGGACQTGTCPECRICNAGVCEVADQGTPCGRAASCVDAIQHFQDKCDINGFCRAGGDIPDINCGTYGCNGTVCHTSCTTDAQCFGTAHCEAPICVGQLPNGGPCTKDSDCLSEVCDPLAGFCCNVRCQEGFKCRTPDFQSCGPAVCQPQCDGKACGADNGCFGTCQTGSCGPGSVCVDGVCFGPGTPGDPCTDDRQCVGGICDTIGRVCCTEICEREEQCAGPNNTCVPALCGRKDDICCIDESCLAGYVCNTQTHFCMGCGEENAFCCSEGRPCKAGLTCDLDTFDYCRACGANGQFCCEGTTCNSGLECAWDLHCHTACGGNNEMCCLGHQCDAGFVCRDPDICVACGGTNQPCCSGEDACDTANLVCVEGTCKACGVLKGPCCAEPNRCGAGMQCQFAGPDQGEICVSLSECGGVDEFCCGGIGGTCDQGLTCAAWNLCEVPCGTEGSACCAGDTCNTRDLACNTTTHTCQACGGDGQICCDGPCDNTGLACHPSSHTCVRCGFVAGDPCCDGLHCIFSALTCDGLFCRAV